MHGPGFRRFDLGRSRFCFHLLRLRCNRLERTLERRFLCVCESQLSLQRDLHTEQAKQRVCDRMYGRLTRPTRARTHMLCLDMCTARMLVAHTCSQLVDLLCQCHSTRFFRGMRCECILCTACCTQRCCDGERVMHAHRRTSSARSCALRASIILAKGNFNSTFVTFVFHNPFKEISSSFKSIQSNTTGLSESESIKILCYVTIKMETSIDCMLYVIRCDLTSILDTSKTASHQVTNKRAALRSLVRSFVQLSVPS